MTDKNDDNITKFPDEIERLKRLEKKLKAEKAMQKPASEPILKIPPMVKWLSVILIVSFVTTLLLPVQTANWAFQNLAFIPPLYMTPAEHPLLILTMPFTHVLLHGGWFHLLINLGMLLAFGSAVEKYIGGKPLLAIFLLSAALGAFTHLLLFWGGEGALIGASGGISGMFGALLRILQDKGQMKPGWKGLVPITVLWVGISVLFALFSAAPGGGAIAWSAHIGGFLGGMVFYRQILKLAK